MNFSKPNLFSQMTMIYLSNTVFFDFRADRDTGNDFFVPQIPGGSVSIPGTLSVV